MRARLATWCGTALALALWMAACRSPVPIRDVVETPLAARGEISTEAIDEAIWRAGRKLGWQVERQSPGELVATLHRRSHVAVVAITHDGQRFDIRYQSSRNLGQRRDHIHRNYNVWVERLAARIAAEEIRPIDQATPAPVATEPPAP